MKCKVCGAESGKYPLCRSCNAKKEAGEIIKCSKCGQWHSVNGPCIMVTTQTNSNSYLYNKKISLISHCEQKYYNVIKTALPTGYCVFPQVNLSAFIERTDDYKYRNELFRNVDFLVTSDQFSPMFIIEINDQTHLTKERKERDEKVQKICEEAGIQVIRFWTSYGVNPEYIQNKIEETLKALPVERIHHFDQSHQQPVAENANNNISHQRRSQGCYVATCVYGSYDCPQVWVLRRYRDDVLAKTWYGKAFIRTYYATSPHLVRMFGHAAWFTSGCKKFLDKIICNLTQNGFECTPYEDK